jgi:peptide subunit release factor RF-3
MTMSLRAGMGLSGQAARRRTFAIISHPDAGKSLDSGVHHVAGVMR